MTYDLVNPRKPWLYLAGFVIFGIVSQVSADLLLGDFLEWSFWEGVWRITLLALAVLVLVVSIRSIRWPVSIRRNSRRDTTEVRRLGDIITSPALIVYVSTNKDGPFRKPIKQFGEGEDSRLRHVFLVHSRQSANVAETLYEEINNDASKRYTAHKDGLLADFDDLPDMFRVSQIAVSHAIEQVKNPADVVIDITGGTAIASAGAVLAGQRIDGVTLTYIPRDAQGNFGDVIRRVDVTLEPDRTDEEVAPGGEVGK